MGAQGQFWVLFQFQPTMSSPEEEQENHVGVTLHIMYTHQYPEVAPDWKLEDVKGLSDENERALKTAVDEVVQSSLGMAMAYSMAEVCQDFLKENNVKALSMHEEMMRRQQAD